MNNVLKGIWYWLWGLVIGRPHFERTFWFHGIVGFQLLIPTIIGELFVLYSEPPSFIWFVLTTFFAIVIPIYIICVSIGLWRLGSKRISPNVIWAYRWATRGYVLLCIYALILKSIRLGVI